LLPFASFLFLFISPNRGFSTGYGGLKQENSPLSFRFALKLWFGPFQTASPRPAAGQAPIPPMGISLADISDFVKIKSLAADRAGKVDRIAKHGMQDGKVSDFGSSTTPTGAAPDFLRTIMGGLFEF
jgi:hypothetical protein